MRASIGSSWNGTDSGSEIGNGDVSVNGYGAARAAPKPVPPVVSEANVIALPFADPLYGNATRGDRNAGGQTTVTMTRETATFTIPATEATLPASLLAAGDTLPRARNVSAARSDTVAHGDTVTAPVAVPPPLPTKPAIALTPPPLPSSSLEPIENPDLANGEGGASAEAASEINDQADFGFSEDFDDEEFDVFYTIQEDDEEATRSIAHRLKPASRA